MSALTHEYRRDVLELLLAAWDQVPDQRLGQLIRRSSWLYACSTEVKATRSNEGSRLNALEDYDLIDAVERFVASRSANSEGQ